MILVKIVYGGVSDLHISNLDVPLNHFLNGILYLYFPCSFHEEFLQSFSIRLSLKWMHTTDFI